MSLYIGLFAVLTSVVVKMGIQNRFMDILKSQHPHLSHFLYIESACTHTYWYDVLTWANFNHSVPVRASKMKRARVRSRTTQVTKNPGNINLYRHFSQERSLGGSKVIFHCTISTKPENEIWPVNEVSDYQEMHYSVFWTLMFGNLWI